MARASGRQEGGRMERSFGSRRACCNPFWDKPFHMLCPVTTSHKTLSSEISACVDVTISVFPLYRVKGACFRRGFPAFPAGGRGGGGSLPPSLLLPAAGVPLPYPHAFNYWWWRRPPAPASAPRPPAPLCAPPLSPQHCRRGFTATRSPHRHFGPPLLWSVTPDGFSGRLGAPSRSSSPGAGGRRGAEEPGTPRSPVAPRLSAAALPVGKWCSGQSDGRCCPRATFPFFLSFLFFLFFFFSGLQLFHGTFGGFARRGAGDLSAGQAGRCREIGVHSLSAVSERTGLCSAAAHSSPTKRSIALLCS